MFRTGIGILITAAMLDCLIPALAQGQSHEKKFIELGWDIPATGFLREHWEQMEKQTPFDGVIFKVEVKDASGKMYSSQSAWDKETWEREWFRPALVDLKTCRFTKFTDNFLRFNATPGNLDWSDDAGWAALAGKAAICAWLTREGGAKGLAIDFESYGAKQFRFDPAKKLSFAETASLARKRGRQFTQAVAAEFPHATILALWLNSINFKAGSSRVPEVILATQEYGLLAAFINGMLDALPPTMTLVDGCENGYYLDGEKEYLESAGQMRQWFGAGAQLVAPENRAKYRSQVQAGFGFYLDMYLNEPGSRYYFGPKPEGTRLDRLRDNLGAAITAADQYVWIYGEQCRWWPGPMSDEWMEDRVKNEVGKVRLWEEAMPGLTSIIEWVRDPISAARAQVARGRQEGALVNLARNPQFAAKAPSGPLPDQFSAWQDEKQPRGTFFWDADVGEGSAKAVKVANGVLMQKHVVKPGENYAVEAQCLREGASVCTLLIRWQREDDQWIRWQEDKTFVFEPAEGGWEEAFGAVSVPRDAEQLVILLTAREQLAADDICWFDNVGLYRLK